MVFIPAGEFLMGSDPQEDKAAEDNEQPQHRLYVPDYYLAKTPVTNAQYRAFVQASSHKKPDHWAEGRPPRGREEHPVVLVSWYDAMAYCRWLSEVTGGTYGLPSEAEWEKAARGTDGRIYPWGHEWDATRCNAGNVVGDTTPVGAYPQGASPYGILDMAGNVWEWTRSLQGRYPYPSDAKGREQREDLGPNDQPRVLRGGALCGHVSLVRCAFRHWFFPVGRSRDARFRVVVLPAL
jgi:formylglycine-generating enzyme required for sulfatase activity